MTRTKRKGKKTHQTRKKPYPQNNPHNPKKTKTEKKKSPESKEHLGLGDLNSAFR